MATETSCENQRQTYRFGMRRRRFILMTLVMMVSILTSVPSCLVSAFATPNVITKAAFAIHTRNSNNRCRSSLSASGGKNKNLSNSEQGRRDEDRRRKERKDDVIIGKTSAKPGASDYAIDPEATEREYLLKASQEERMVHELTDKGMNEIKSLRLDLADQYFDKVFELRPEAYLWQAGIVKFYLGNIEGASEIFAKSANHFETKFGPMGMGPASEERIWRSAAELKYISKLKKKERKQYKLDRENGNTPIAQMSNENDESTMGPETRLVHRLARELFDASIEAEKSSEVVARAKLLSFAESESGTSSGIPTMSQDIKKRKLNACYFLALHYDVTGEIEESKKWIKVAFKLCNMNAGKSSDIIDTLPLLHMTARDWFDDDPYEDEEEWDEAFENEGDNSAADSKNSSNKSSVSNEGSKSSGKAEHMSDAYSDPVLEASIMEDVSKMKFDEIRDALRIRGISATGSKETLKERLFISLMDDAGYQSGFAP